MKVKSIFISDIHIGCGANNIKKVIEILESYEFENLYLLGDIIDGWRLRKKWRWKDDYGLFVDSLTKLKKKKVNIIYCTGNHDDFLRPHTPIYLNLCMIVDEYQRDGILMIHGDKFDQFIYNKKWLYLLGDFGYNLLIFADRFFGFKGRISKHIKKIVKGKVNYLNDFYVVAQKYTKSKKCHTLICGHTHIQEYRELDKIKYYNCGDMREDSEFLIEQLDGTLSLTSID